MDLNHQQMFFLHIHIHTSHWTGSNQKGSSLSTNAETQGFDCKLPIIHNQKLCFLSYLIYIDVSLCGLCSVYIVKTYLKQNTFPQHACGVDPLKDGFRSTVLQGTTKDGNFRRVHADDKPAIQKVLIP